MIGKGTSIVKTLTSLKYGWNQEKDAEVVYTRYLAGDTPSQITKEFEIIQSQNTRCQRKTLSFILSPTIEDGKKLVYKDLKEITKRFVKAMDLRNHQAIAFVHRDKEHIHIHLYINRIGFDGRAYNASFIGKRSQYAARKVAREMGISTVQDVQQEKLNALQHIRSEIKEIHENVMSRRRPKDFDQYIKYMNQHEVQVIPSINKSHQLQGFRFAFKDHNFKGSAVHHDMSGGKLAVRIARNTSIKRFQKDNKVKLAGKVTEMGANLVASIAKSIIKKAITKGADVGMGF